MPHALIDMPGPTQQNPVNEQMVATTPGPQLLHLLCQIKCASGQPPDKKLGTELSKNKKLASMLRKLVTGVFSQPFLR